MDKRRRDPYCRQTITVRIRGSMVDYIESVLKDDLYDTPRALIYDLLRQHKLKSFEQIRSNKKRK